MADLRCPMCGRTNGDHLEECQFCGARLKPLVIQPDPDKPPANLESLSPNPPTELPAADSAEGDVPGWLARIRSIDASMPAPKPPSLSISELRRTTPPEASPPDEPAPKSGADWLTAIRSQAKPMQTAPLTPPASDPSEQSQVDWLARLRERHPAEEPRFPTPKVESPPDSTPSGPATDELGRTRRSTGSLLRGQASLPPQTPPPTETPTEAPSEPAQPDVPDWLQNIRSAEASANPPARPPAQSGDAWGSAFSADEGEAQKIPDWLRSFDAEIPPTPRPSVGEIPDTSAFDFLEPAPTAPAESSLAPADLPDWLRAMRPKDLDLSAEISEDSSGEQAGALPRRPTAPAPPGDDLAAASLPSWLEGMRPIEGQRPSRPDDERTEGAGPLAGMRGILGAEPVIAMPRKPPAQSSKLEISDVHAAQAELLRGMLIEEIRQKPLPKRRPFDLRADRWLVVLFMLAAVVAPTFAGGPLLASPEGAPLETFAVYNAVEALPPDSPVLMAFEFGPASAGELDAEARTLINHLMKRGARIAVVSSQPSGAAIGHAALGQQVADAGYEYGQNYVHLGYLSGGSTGLLDLAIQPKAAVVRDYSGEFDPWASPALAGVNRLGDFRMIVVLTGSPEAGRAWIEQVRPFAAVPMVAVVSAGAETLMRPYYESDSPQLVGLVTGLNGAASYEALTRAPGLARDRWDAYGFGILAATGLIAAGNLITAVLGLFRSRSET